MSEPLITRFKYFIEEDRVETESQIKDECLPEILVNFIQDLTHTIRKRDEPEVEAINRKVYTISFALLLEDDSFRYGHDCGNKGLLVGILLRILQLIDKEKPKNIDAQQNKKVVKSDFVGDASAVLEQMKQHGASRPAEAKPDQGSVQAVQDPDVRGPGSV